MVLRYSYRRPEGVGWCDPIGAAYEQWHEINKQQRMLLMLETAIDLAMQGFPIERVLQAFAEVDILTQGNPANTTQTLLYEIFQNDQPATVTIGAVLSVGLFVVTAMVTAIQFTLLERRVHYGS